MRTPATSSPPAPPGRRGGRSPWQGDARALARELERSVRGAVRFDAQSRVVYSTDASNYRQVPIGVVYPRDAADVEAAVAACRRFGAPLLGRGGGTSLAGQCCNTAVVLDFSRHMSRVLEVDPASRRARVEPGAILDDLRAAAQVHGLTFGPDPSTHAQCTLGGMIGNNACGVHSVMAGRTVDNVEELEILTYDGLRMRVGPTGEEELAALAGEESRRGHIYAELAALRDRYASLVRSRFPDIPRRVSGYNLDELLPEKGCHVARSLVGSEGTCATVLEATVRLVPWPAHRVLLVVAFTDVFTAADRVPEVMAQGPIGLEGLEGRILEDLRRQGGLQAAELAALAPEGGWLLVELGGESEAAAVEKALALARGLEGGPGVVGLRLCREAEEQQRIWAIREAGLSATARMSGGVTTWPGWEDSAVAPERLGEYMRRLRRLLDAHGLRGDFYGHFGQGCLHSRISFDLASAEGIRRFRAFMEEAADLVAELGGSLSGEHGDGQARAELLPRLYGPELARAFSEYKAIWDPAGKMNPGKVADPYPLDAHLRLGADYRPWEPTTRFAFAEDGSSFSAATLRCVGVGKCRRLRGGTMCPSYRATREEAHSTRGRARLLFEMLHGEVVRGGWRGREVKEALDFCLACKGCKAECPAQVDVATYKAELFHHYYRWRPRPRQAYAMGLVYWWARLASRAPRLANALTGAPVVAPLLKAVAGVARERRIPRLAKETFRRRFRRRPPGAPAGTGDGRRVILWPDTFTNFFEPDVAHAAVEVLVAAGFAPELPRRTLCCGRPLYDFGMLDLARRQLRQILAALEPEIAAGVPVVGLEPSCVATFRDELPALFPDDERARRLSRRVLTLAELLASEAPEWAPPPAGRRALVHGHCHHKALMGMEADGALLARAGLEAEILDAGCCGMAGAFGSEVAKLPVSLACGEAALLPAVRAAAAETLILADGFSCRQQIAQTTPRRALHLAQALALGLGGAE